MSGYVPQHAPLIEYRFPLGKQGRFALVTIQEDITEREAAKLANLIKTLPVDPKDYETPITGENK